MNRIFKILFKSTGVLLFTLVLFCCENDIKKIEEISKLDTIPDIYSLNYSMLYSDSTKVLFNLRAPRIEQFSKLEKPFTEFKEGINVVYFSRYPDTSSMFRANYAIRYDNEALWETKGDVVARNTKGEVLNTEFLIWDEKGEKLHSDRQVTVRTNQDIIQGIGFESDQDFSNWTIKKVTGTFIIDE